MEYQRKSDNYAVHLALPKKDNLLRAVSRKRRKEMCLQTPAPVDWHFEVPNEFAPFLLQDSGNDDDERILKFGDSTMKKLLSLSNTWLIDRTCILSLGTFYQIDTIHVELHGLAQLCLCVRLPNNTGKTLKNDSIADWRNCPKCFQNTGRLRKSSAEFFQQKISPSRNLVLFFLLDAIF